MRDLALRLAEARTRRHLSDDAALGRATPPMLAGRARRSGLVDPGRVYEDDRRTFGPPLRFGLAVARHLCASRPRLRRRAHRVVPVLPSSRRRRVAATRWLPHRRRLARGVDALLLASLRRRDRRHDRLARAARVHPCAAARVLRCRGCTPAARRRRLPRAADRPAGRLRGTDGQRAEGRGRSVARRLRRTARDGEARRALVRAFGARANGRSCGSRSTATDRSAGASRRSSRSSASRTRPVAGHRPEEEVAAALSAARRVSRPPPSARATGSSSSRRRRAARRASSSPARRTRRPSSSSEGSTAPSQRAPSPRISARRSCASWRPGRRCASRPHAGSSRTRAELRLDRSLELVLRRVRASLKTHFNLAPSEYERPREATSAAGGSSSCASARAGMAPETVVEIGCGPGGLLAQLAASIPTSSFSVSTSTRR